MRQFSSLLLILLAWLGFLDAGYLTFEHYQNILPPCSTNLLFIDCGKVLRSEYASFFGLPVSLLGIFYYGSLLIAIIFALLYKKRLARILILPFTTIGAVASLYFIFLQLFVIHAICLFCMISAIICLSLFLLAITEFSKERKILFVRIIGIMYRNFLRPILFRFDPEVIHTIVTRFTEVLGRNQIAKKFISMNLTYYDKALSQKIAGINFKNPLILSAGFDYEARLTQILPHIGFGGETIGTITNKPYEGNPKPRLGRLPKSQSLMVNKGFKNLGVKQTIAKLSGLNFAIPIGISIGRTNSKEPLTQKESIKDIIQAFNAFEKSSVHYAYYELNISCPNLFGTISFYSPKNLGELLSEIDKLRLTRPLFVKMPIEKTDEEVMSMLRVISKHSPVGVIFGNLQKERRDPAFDQKEVKKFRHGNFSGKPTYKRSNELIKLSYCHFPELIIIGCGGVFTAEDAYTKITLGASLIQLITGMIFRGPQVITEINSKLVDLLQKDGFTHISQAIGSKNKTT